MWGVGEKLGAGLRVEMEGIAGQTCFKQGQLQHGSEFWVLGFGFRASGSGFRVSGFGFQVSGVRFRASCFGLAHVSEKEGGADLGLVCSNRVPGFGFRVPGSGFRVPGFGLWVPNFEFRVSGFGFRLSGFGFRTCVTPRCIVGGDFPGLHGNLLHV